MGIGVAVGSCVIVAEGKNGCGLVMAGVLTIGVFVVGICVCVESSLTSNGVAVDKRSKFSLLALAFAEQPIIKIDNRHDNNQTTLQFLIIDRITKSVLG